MKLKNRWGQPRVSSTLTFGTTRLGTEKPLGDEPGGISFGAIGQMYTRCTQTVLIWEIGSGGLGLPLQQIGDGGRMGFLHLTHHMGIQVEGDGDRGVTQGFGHYLGVDASQQPKGRIHVAQSVEGHVGQVVRSDEPGERLGNFLGYQGQSAGSSEYIPGGR